MITNAYINPFASINTKLPSTDQMTILARPSHNRARLAKFETMRPLQVMRNKITLIDLQKSMIKKKTALLISQEYFTNNLKPLGDPPWAIGLLVYAVTGTQLIYGVTEIPRGYGFTPYYEPHTALSNKFIGENNICENQSIASTLILFSTAQNGLMIECDGQERLE